MPSGDIIAVVERIVLPDANGAQWTEIVGGSTPAERWPALAFSTGDYADLYCKLSENYNGGGLDIELIGVSSAGSINYARMEAAIRTQIANVSHQLSDAHTYAYQAVETQVSSTALVDVHHAIAMTPGAQMDGLTTGLPSFVLRLRRVAPAVQTDYVGDWNVRSVVIKEA